MKSIVKNIYPQVVWRDGEKMLWNPIHRKPLKNRPEERIRLRVIESLITAGWSKHRLSTEESIRAIGDSILRTDLICYSQQFEPVILVECKAESVAISAKTAEQVARYNQQVKAPYVMMTNGRKDFWYQIDEEEISHMKQKPSFLNGTHRLPDYQLSDWKKRGFAGSKAIPVLRKWVENMLPELWFNQQEIIQFLNFSQSLSDLNLNHYYCIKPVSPGRKIALSTLNTPFGGTRLVAIINEENENKAVLEVNLDLLFDGQTANTSLYSNAGISTFDLHTYFELPATKNINTIFSNLNRVFDDKSSNA